MLNSSERGDILVKVEEHEMKLNEYSVAFLYIAS